jgi:WD40 repeat protein
MTGERLTILRGHSLAITCLMLLDRNKLLSGSADKTIRVKNIFEFKNYKKITKKKKDQLFFHL